MKDIKNTTIRYLLTTNFIAIEKHFYINSTGEEDTEQFSTLLEEILTSDFKVMGTFFKKEFRDADIVEMTFLINADIKYLEWAINTVDNFSIPPHIIKKENTHYILRRFEIKRLSSTIFEYKPVIEEVEIKFNDEIKKINLAKFQKKFKVIYDFENGIYIHNLTEDELYNKFGYFLDENYQSSDVEVEYDEEVSDYEDNGYNDYDHDYFDAMTDGQLGDYDDFREGGGNLDDIDTWARG